MLRQVAKRYGAREVLAELSLELAAGARLGLIGPAASGKSVVLKLVAGLEQADAGEVETLGERVTGKREAELGPLRRRIGMLFQNYALFDSLTVEDNVAFPLRQRLDGRRTLAGSAAEGQRGGLDGRRTLAGSAAEGQRGGIDGRRTLAGSAAEGQRGGIDGEIAARVAERIRAVGLAGSEHKLTGELSGGMKKRAGIARATVADAELVLYDEPSAGLDPVTTQKIYDLLAADQARTGATVIAVSSDVVALAGFVDEIAFLDRGHILYRGPAATIADAPDAHVRSFVRGEL